ncbi:50S ribosomal protein L2, partial [Listeria monocytogenes]|nr:50S ribosomal protein L2 [Listeria monocytogenes]
HKQRYRIIDFKRRNWGVDGVVERIEYDPNRTAFIALINYGQTADGKENVAYIIAPQRFAVGDKVIADKKTDVKPGNAMELGQMPVGTIVH